MKRLCYGLLGALVAAMLLAALVLFFPPAFKFGLKTANRFLPVAVDIEGVRHVPGRLRLSGLRIATPMGTSCEVAALEIAYRPLSLALGRIDITTLEVRNPTITILRFPEGKLDTLEPSAKSGKRPGQGSETGTGSWEWLLLRLRVEAFLITDGSVHVHPLGHGLSLAWDSLDLAGDFSGHPLGGNLHVRKGCIRAVSESYPPLEMTTKGDALLADGRIRLTRFRMTSQDAAVSLRAVVALAEQRSRLDAQFSAVPLDRILELIGVGRVGVERISGGLKVNATGNNTAGFKADLSGPIHGRQARARIEGRLQDGVVTYEIHAGPSLQLTGRLKLEGLHAETFVQAKGLDLSSLTKQWTRSASSLSVTGKASFLGNLDRKETWEGEAKIDKLLCSFPDLVIASARPIELHIEKGLLKGKASLEANGRPLSVHGSYSFLSQGTVKLEGSASLALEDFLQPARSILPSLRAWKGDLRIQGALEGPARAPRLHAVADVSDGSFRLAPPEEQALDRPPETEGAGTEGVMEGTEPGGILAGGARMHLELDGAVTEPAGSLDLGITGGRLYGIPLDEIHLKAASRDGRQWNTRMEIRSDRAALSIDGLWNVPTGVISGDIRSTELDLASLVGSGKMPIQGISHIQGILRGTIDSPRVELRAETRSLAIQGIPIGHLDTDLAYDPERLSVKGKTDSGWFEAWVKIQKEPKFSFRGSLEGFPVGPFLEAAHLRGWNGQVSLSGELEGPVANIQRWEGAISLKRLGLHTGAEPLRLEGPVSLRFARGNVTIPETSLLMGDSRLRMRGSLGQKNSLSVRGTIPLRPFAPLIAFVRYDTGKAEADLTVRGTMSSPVLDGRIHLEAGQVKVPGLAYPADSIEADLQAASNRFTLHSFSANVADGKLHGSGTMTLNPLAFEKGRLSLEAVPVRLSDSLVGSLRGELAFEGDRESSVLSGSMEIIEARYEENFNLVGMLLLPSRPRQDGVRKAAPFFENMRLDLHVRSGPSLLVRNNLGRLILSTNMEIKGTAANPVPLGIVRAEEGRIFFSNKRFTITQGSLAFSDPSGGRPRLQIESKVKVQGQSREYSIYLTLMGPLDRIRLELSSAPDLEREDIIFMLLTGKTRDEYYASAEEPTDMEETAQRLAVSGIGSLFGNDVRALTGLDTFLLERTEGKAFGVKTTVGKQFNERIDVRGIFALGTGQQVSEARVGYLLTDMFYVVGTQRTDGSFGLDFRIRIGSQ